MRDRQMTRTWRIQRALERSRRGLSAAEVLALDLGCSARTVYRDLAWLEEVGFATRSDDGRYEVVRSPSGGASIPLDPTTVLAVMLSQDLLGPLRATPLAEPLAELQGKLAAMLTPKGREYLDELRRSLLGTTFVAPSYAARDGVIRAVQDAIGRQHRLRFRYRAAGTAPADRVVEPYFTWVTAGRLYLVGMDAQREDVRTFAVQRMDTAEVLDEAFEPDPGFDPAEFVRRGMGVFHGPVHHVVMDFDAEVAYVAHERVLHPSQRLRERADGSVRLTMDAAGLPEIAAWVASFGGRVRPVAPGELVERVREIHRAGLARLSDP